MPMLELQRSVPPYGAESQIEVLRFNLHSVGSRSALSRSTAHKTHAAPYGDISTSQALSEETEGRGAVWPWSTARDSDFLREFGGRTFLCNVEGRPVHYTPQVNDIVHIVEQALAQADYAGQHMPVDAQRRRQCMIGIVKTLHTAVTEGVVRLDAFEIANRLAAESVQWPLATALAIDVAAMQRTIIGFCAAAVRRAEQLWVQQTRPQAAFSIGDVVSIAMERARRTKAVVTRIDSGHAEYHVRPLDRPGHWVSERAVPFELVQSDREGGDDGLHTLGQPQSLAATQGQRGKRLPPRRVNATSPEPAQGQARSFADAVEQLLAFLVKHQRAPQVNQGRERALAESLESWQLELPPGLTLCEHRLALELRIVLRALSGFKEGGGLPDGRTVQRLGALIEQCKAKIDSSPPPGVTGSMPNTPPACPAGAPAQPGTLCASHAEVSEQ